MCCVIVVHGISGKGGKVEFWECEGGVCVAG